MSISIATPDVQPNCVPMQQVAHPNENECIYIYKYLHHYVVRSQNVTRQQFCCVSRVPVLILTHLFYSLFGILIPNLYMAIYMQKVLWHDICSRFGGTFRLVSESYIAS